MIGFQLSEKSVGSSNFLCFFFFSLIILCGGRNKQRVPRRHINMRRGRRKGSQRGQQFFPELGTVFYGFSYMGKHFSLLHTEKTITDLEFFLGGNWGVGTFQ